MADHSWIHFLHPPRPNFEAPDEDAARVLMDSDPAIASGVVR